MGLVIFDKVGVKGLTLILSKNKGRCGEKRDLKFLEENFFHDQASTFTQKSRKNPLKNRGNNKKTKTQPLHS